MTTRRYEQNTQFEEISKKLNAADPNVTWNTILSVHPKYGKCAPVSDASVHDGSLPKPPNHIRFVCISDTHGLHRRLNLPDGDILLHTGDITKRGEVKTLEDFASWLTELPYSQKVVIAGNHDLTIHTSYFMEPKNYEHILGKRANFNEFNSARAREVLCKAPESNFIYLEDESFTVMGGYKVYGSPWQPEFYNWAFNLQRGEDCAKMWEKIPIDTDILMTHGPPIGHGDKCSSGDNAGCVDLLARIVDHVKPVFHVFGHIHEGYGATTNGSTTFVNPSTCTLQYQPIQPPLVFDLPDKEKV